ncbi:hypothetical protein HMPREF9136_0842 [Prevotella dentalis DSM 3688]|uniref:Uncharacterized protein n=1 Tax=Prevotella dentalis (strain ATCC 49559 / DSM 3688 / JCM 13448 / NCTC 12043 / ES 2772) TaxID=908937 RepID=F9D1W4_PREDD|nr:hypothetical protein HMPREF9136_0842 [Prevotella dentalis DSM 3688]
MFPVVFANMNGHARGQEHCTPHRVQKTTTNNHKQRYATV